MADLTKHGLEPVAWLYHDESQRLLGFRRDYFASAEGLTETALYPADQVAALVERIGRLEGALIRLQDCDWVISLPDRMDAVRDIARAALKENSDETSD